jgi:hypothetical protein
LDDEPNDNLDSKSTENLLVNKARRVIALEDGKIISDVRK